MAEFTPLTRLQFRATALGLVIGCLLCFTNLYFGLQTGWISMYDRTVLSHLLTLILLQDVTAIGSHRFLARQIPSHTDVRSRECRTANHCSCDGHS